MTGTTETNIDLTTYPFPKLSAEEIEFSTLRTRPELLEEADLRGFGRSTPYDKLFSTIFFSGGKLNYKKGLDKEFMGRAIPYLKAFMRSFEPKHEHKSAICAMLLSELVDL